MKIIAHRGASGYAPENTLLSLEKAIQLGADVLEFDVHVLSSGEVVLMHDHRVNRTTNGLGYLLKHDFQTLRALDAGAGEIIPTLEEALDFISRRIQVNVELKGPGTAAPVAKIISQYLQGGWEPTDFLVSSFNHHELVEFKRLLPAIKIAALNDAIPLGYATFAEQLGAVAVCPGDEFVDAAYVQDAHQRGLEIYVWTINDPEEIERMCEMGVDGIFTDFPDRSRQAAEAYK